MIELVIVGAGGHAKVVVDAVLRQDLYRIIGVVGMPEADRLKSDLLGFEIKYELSEYPTCMVFVAVGDNHTRMVLFRSAVEQGFSPARIVHPQACVSDHASIEAGALVCAGAIVGPGAIVRENAIVNTAATVDHDSIVEAHAHVAVGAHLAGRAVLKEGAFLGMGALLLPGIKLGSWATAGAGAVVNRDVPDNDLVVGIPARPIGK